jgi:hypothetical protein
MMSCSSYWAQACKNPPTAHHAQLGARDRIGQGMTRNQSSVDLKSPYSNRPLKPLTTIYPPTAKCSLASSSFTLTDESLQPTGYRDPLVNLIST